MLLATVTNGSPAAQNKPLKDSTWGLLGGPQSAAPQVCKVGSRKRDKIWESQLTWLETLSEWWWASWQGCYSVHLYQAPDTLSFFMSHGSIISTVPGT